ncbi:MAG: HesA/MoeB/ThiF family protein [Thermodesulfobacteriaceae bacterium]|nr:HesA/MoeB/ThiF family protein [Thermodesulfobacteriaceae bacterium]MCX8042128.1 HesA/MoeB/ThiF family protein [Thermodesulfobacteriaceae bacterium]MDW8135738.1 HesA/MoeB/ThiF family protein [Thermodesulfobacterium sp.]
MKRYEKNIGTLSLDEFLSLRRSKVCVVGCGGLGGYVIELLARLGVGYLTVVDKDVFEESNLNRQILCELNSLGKSKALVAKERLKNINPEVEVQAMVTEINLKNGKEILRGHDLVIDALDNAEGKKFLEELAEALEIPLVHGAVAGWFGQVACIFPGDRLLKTLYLSKTFGIEKEIGVPSFTPALIASFQVSEAIKILIKRGEVLRKKVLLVNLLKNEIEVIEFN